MANRFYGLNRGQTEFNVTEGASTGSVDVEVNIDLTKNLTKEEVLQIIYMLGNHILKNTTKTFGL